MSRERVDSRNTLAVLCGAIAFALCSQALADPELAAVSAAYREHLSCLSTVRARFHFSLTFPDGIPPKLQVQSRGVWPAAGGTAVIDWAFDGERYLFHQQPRLADGRPTIQHFYGFDGRHSFSVTSFDPDGRLGQVYRRDGLPPETIHEPVRITPAHLLGEKVPGSLEDIWSLLNSGSARLVEQHSAVSGHECMKVDLGVHPCEAPHWRQHIVAWFDPSAGYLPRRIVLQFVEQDESSGEWKPVQPKEAHRSELEVLEFASRADDQLARTVWFPLIGEHRQDTNIARIEVQSVEINSELPLSVFQPEILAGDEMIVASNKPGELAEPHLAGGTAAVDALVCDRLQEAATLPYAPEAGEKSVDARPRSALRGVFMSVFLVSLLALALSIWFRWRS